MDRITKCRTWIVFGLLSALIALVMVPASLPAAEPRAEERHLLYVAAPGIRNDLHDELAPTLSSLQLQLGAMRSLIRQDPKQAEAIANELLRRQIETIEAMK